MTPEVLTRGRNPASRTKNVANVCRESVVNIDEQKCGIAPQSRSRRLPRGGALSWCGGSRPVTPLAPTLSLEHRQIVAFIGAYLSEYGCLPAVTEVAQGCGFGSSRPADRLMRELESYGVIRRDNRYSRLGQLTVVAPDLLIDASAQLFMTELAQKENAAFLMAVRRALDLAPADASHVAALHLEGLKRATLVRSYDAVSAHLLNTGAGLSLEDRRALEDYDGILAELDALYADWDALCLCRLVWNLSILQWVRGVDPLGLGYVGSSLVATMRTLTALIPSYRQDAARALATDPRREELFDQLAVLLMRYRRGMARRIPFEPHQLAIDVGVLLAVDERPPRRLRAPRLGPG